MQMLAFTGYVVSFVLVITALIRGETKWAVAFLGFVIVFAFAFACSALMS